MGRKLFQPHYDREFKRQVTRLVLKKLAAGMLPPSIDKHELDSMKVKY